MATPRKSAANRRNAQSSTGPRTAAGKAAASVNARTHGLNTPVPDYVVRACVAEHRALLDYARAKASGADLSDLVYALATHARLRDHRAGLMKLVVIAGQSVDAALDPEALRDTLGQLRRLETYERKSRSRLGRLLQSL